MTFKTLIIVRPVSCYAREMSTPARCELPVPPCIIAAISVPPAAVICDP